MFLPGRLVVGFGSEDAWCKDTPRDRWGEGQGAEEMGGPEKDPASSSSRQEGSPWCSWPSRCERPGRCWDMLQHLPVPITRTCLSSLRGWQENHCRAENLPQRRRSPPPPWARLPVLSAIHARRGGDAAGARRGRSRLGITTSLCRWDPGSLTQPMPGTAGTSKPVKSEPAQPHPCRVGGLEPHLFSRLLIDC